MASVLIATLAALVVTVITLVNRIERCVRETEKETAMRGTIYDEIGGEPAVSAVVEAVYERLVADPDLMPYLEGRDMERLKAHQRALVTVALGGTSEEYNGRMMHPAHAGMVITHEAFDKVLDHLLVVLLGAGVPPVTCAKILAILQPLRADVVQAPVAVAG